MATGDSPTRKAARKNPTRITNCKRLEIVMLTRSDAAANAIVAGKRSNKMNEVMTLISDNGVLRGKSAIEPA